MFWRSARTQPRARLYGARLSIFPRKEILFGYLIASLAQNNCKYVDHKIADVKKKYLLSCASNFFLQMRILWERNITWSKLQLSTKISLTGLSGLEKKQDDVL